MTQPPKSPPAPPKDPTASQTESGFGGGVAVPVGRPETAKKPEPIEIGGPAGPEPTRYGDWEVKGRCSDF